MTALNPVMRVGEQIAEGPRVRLGQAGAGSASGRSSCMRLVGIPDPERRYRAYPHELSGGLRQRIVIAIALAASRSCCSATSRQRRSTSRSRIRSCTCSRACARRRRHLGASSRTISRRRADVRARRRHVRGAHRRDGHGRGGVRAPRHPYTRALLRSVPDFDGAAQHLESIPGMPPDLVSPPSGCRFHPRCDIVQRRLRDHRSSAHPRSKATARPRADYLRGGGGASACAVLSRCSRCAASRCTSRSTPRSTRRLRKRAGRRAACGRRRRPAGREGRGARPRRRVRLRQVDARPLHRRPLRADRGRGAARGTRAPGEADGRRPPPRCRWSSRTRTRRSTRA